MYAVSAKIPIEAWSDAIVWAKDKNCNHILGENVGNVQEIFVPSKTFVNHNNRKLDQVDVDTFISNESDEFNEFIDNMFSMWVINFDMDDWSKSDCTCPKYLKFLHCKHILGLSLRLSKAKAPAAANPVQLTEKRKRGRPKVTKKALIRQ